MALQQQLKINILKVIFFSDSNKYISIAKKFKCDFYYKVTKLPIALKDINVFKEVFAIFVKKIIIYYLIILSIFVLNYL